MLDALFASINNHPTAWAMGTAYIFIAAVNSLPEPGSNLPLHQVIYMWVYDFLHVLSNRVAKRYPPTDPVPQQIIHTFATSAQPIIVPKP